MVRVINMECDVPLEPGVTSSSGYLRPSGADGPDRLGPPPGYGMDNYDTIFASRTQERSGAVDPDLTLDGLVDMMDKAGIVKALVFGASNARAAEVIAAHPARFMAFANISPYDGMRGSRELERLVRDEGFSGLRVSALSDVLPATDRRYYPLYAKCVDLGIPVRIYTAMSYANDRPYDLGHPRHVDQVAVDFPELTIITGLGGWPWVNEMVGILRRHPNLYCDTSAHRPRHFATKGSGWEMLLQFGNTLLQDKIMVGLSHGLLGDTFENLIEEYLNLPLKDAVKEKWLYGNAARLFGVS